MNDRETHVRCVNDVASGLSVEWHDPGAHHEDITFRDHYVRQPVGFVPSTSILYLDQFWGFNKTVEPQATLTLPCPLL